MANLEVLIISNKYSRNQIKEAVKKTNEGKFLKIHEQAEGARLRGIDSTVLVAVVGATGTGLGALIAGLFQLLSEKKNEKIVLRSSSGASIEFPANLPPPKIEELILTLKKLDNEKYQILLP